MILGNTDSTITEYSLFNRQHFFYQTHPKNTPSGKCGFGAASAKVD